jgi:hypothetical protein
VRARYLLGSKLARDLRALPGKEYEDVYRSYGPRSFLYAEMVFGNTFNVRHLIASTPQLSIHAMRVPRAISIAEIIKRTRLPADEVRRFNPALVDRVPAHATLTFRTVSEFGADVAFWRLPPTRRMLPFLMTSCASTPVLSGGTIRPSRLSDGLQTSFQRDEHGRRPVMETVLAYAMDQAYTSTRRALVSEFRNSEQVRHLIERGMLELAALRHIQAPRVAAAAYDTAGRTISVDFSGVRAAGAALQWHPHLPCPGQCALCRLPAGSV